MRYVTGRVTATPMNAETKLRMISSVVITMHRSPRMHGLSHLLKKIRGAASLEMKFARFEPCCQSEHTNSAVCYVGQTTLAEATVRTQAARKLPGVDNVEVTLNRELLVGTDFVHSLIRGKVREQEGEGRKTEFRSRY